MKGKRIMLRNPDLAYRSYAKEMQAGSDQAANASFAPLASRRQRWRETIFKQSNNFF